MRFDHHSLHAFRSSPLLAGCVVALLYFVFGHVSFLTMVSHSIVTPVFFVPEGIALAAVILLGPQIWPGIFIGQLALALSRGLSIEPALVISAVNSLEAVIAVTLVRYWNINPKLERLRDFTRLLILILLVLQPLSATLGTATLFSFGIISDSQSYTQAWINWWIGNSLGQSQLTPLLLVAYFNRGAIRESMLKVVLPFALLIPAAWLTFGGLAFGSVAATLVLFVPLLLWIADRGGIVPVSIASSLIACLAFYLTARGLGPFVSDQQVRILDLDVFIMGLALTTQLYSLLARERRELHARIEKIATHISGMIYQYQRWPDGRAAFPYASEGIQNIYGVRPEDVSTDASLVFKTLHPEDVQMVAESIDASARNMSVWNAQYRVNHPNGKTIWVEGESTPQIMSDGSILWHGFIHDITERKLAEDQLRITARIFDRAGEAIVVTDARGTIQMVNGAFRKITGYEPAEAIGQSTKLLKSGRHSEDFYQKMWHTLHEKGFWQDEIWNKRKDGEIYPEWLTINRVDNPDGKTEHFVAVFSDISQIKDSQRRAQYLSTHDPLTGLPNRTLFQDRLGQALNQARRNEGRVALLFIDLDNFKTINDTLGHDIGDALLRQAAQRLRAAVRDVDTVARLGGDEFTAILSDGTDKTASQVARRILNDLSTAFDIDGRSLFVSASIGAAFFPDDSGDASGLTKAADAAMYRAKEQGRNRIEFFKSNMQERLFKRVAIENALRDAVRAKRLTLVYQPKYRIGTGRRLIGAEALLRWNDPEMGIVSPGEFIPVAEASGLILELGQLVEELLLTQMSDWHRRGLRLLPIAFNVSPRSIREPDFASQLIERIAATGLPNELLQVEITEGALLENSNHVVENLALLDAAGLKIAIDDFGTGYSSLSYLKRLPIDELKIDKSFVDGLGQDKEDEAIARAVLGLAKALDLKTVAEGVETDRQFAWLVQFGCDIAQGYLLSRPVDASVFEQILRRESVAGNEHSESLGKA